MARDETKRVNPAVLEADMAAFAALQAITDYAPVNPAFTPAALSAAHRTLIGAQTAEAQTAAAAAAARDTAVAREWDFHNLVLGAKDQVIAQYGRNSNEVQALGLKKASEYRSRARKPAAPQP